MLKRKILAAEIEWDDAIVYYCLWLQKWIYCVVFALFLVQRHQPKRGVVTEGFLWVRYMLVGRNANCLSCWLIGVLVGYPANWLACCLVCYHVSLLSRWFVIMLVGCRAAWLSCQACWLFGIRGLLVCWFVAMLVRYHRGWLTLVGLLADYHAGWFVIILAGMLLGYHTRLNSTFNFNSS